MKEKETKDIKKRISTVNELRNKFWTEYRKLRNDFLSNYPSKEYESDSDWQELFQSINDMFQSCVKEDIRRQLITRQNPFKVGEESGLLSNNRLCVVCKLPLTGRQTKYCSERCKGISKSRKFRKEHPAEKMKSDHKYLDSIKEDFDF